MANLRRSVLLALALAVVAGAVWSRLRPRPRADPPDVEERVAPAPAEPSAAVSDARPSAPDVGPTVERVFGGAVTPDDREHPWFAPGDFDGDSVTDLAVAVRLREGAALGDAPSVFRLQDAELPGPAPPPTSFAAGERLLAVVTGVAGAAWSDGRAERTGFLVRRAVGQGLRAAPLEGLPAEVRMRVTRAHAGHVIATSRGGRRGCTFWNGASFVWTELPDDGRAVRAGGRPALP